jgi:hypothetical protein
MQRGGTPDIEALIRCGNRVADEIKQPRPEENQARVFFLETLHKTQAQGGRDLWGCFAAGLITETELRDATMARYATWLSHINGTSEPAWQGSPAIHACFERALFGAHRV